ncbi:MAG: hypothetical protein B0A82_25075 [Alkalinema sp. CACIAM 70d]|nr:MAG: hypothetical protein B0A82_25075 [Alkalinema sp. CACIAM 70d]
MLEETLLSSELQRNYCDPVAILPKPKLEKFNTASVAIAIYEHQTYNLTDNYTQYPFATLFPLIG